MKFYILLIGLSQILIKGSILYSRESKDYHLSYFHIYKIKRGKKFLINGCIVHTVHIISPPSNTRFSHILKQCMCLRGL